MRIKLTLELPGRRQVLPLNYQYPLSSWIYSVFSKSDKEFTGFLHGKGYRLENGKNFKLFTFSRLKFPHRTARLIKGTDRMEIVAGKAFFEVAFYLPETAQHFITGLFNEQTMRIGDKISQVEMKVVSVEVEKQPVFTDGTSRWHALTPVVITKTEEGRKHERYLSPEDEDFEKLFAINLLDKYRAACIFSGRQAENFNADDIRIKNLSAKPKSALQKIKAYTAEETSVRGYIFDFELTAPASLQEVGLNAGFGAMSSIGFGFCNLLVS